MSQPAVFLDRDGTLVYPRHYPSRPEELHVYENIAPGLRKIQRAGFRLVVITNQAGIARGFFSSDDLRLMHEYLAREFEQRGVRLDGIYHCPHHPEGVIPELAIRCTCRKPAPGMLLSAAAELQIDLARSWLVGDILDDVEAGHRAGCRSILVDLGTEQRPLQPLRCPDFVARDTAHALRIIRTVERLGAAAHLAYCPPAWGTLPRRGRDEARPYVC